MKKIALLGVALGAALLVAGGASAADGKKVFNKCKSCHSLEVGKNKVGPYLNGMIGRTAGSVDGFKYSKILVEAGAQGLVWDEQNLVQYLENPQKFLKAYVTEKGGKASGRSKMSFRLKKSDDAVAVIDYINSQ
ncbi:c-type cytochrome [Kiloniella sp. b19]|uniref:c-type cytochrome n=1 Tax=Kiloniella sp. GXU_MW_B19 TaxID=3141326 RepID=UPI0031D540C0